MCEVLFKQNGKITIYMRYKKRSTARLAVRYLTTHGIEFAFIREV